MAIKVLLSIFLLFVDNILQVSIGETDVKQLIAAAIVDFIKDQSLQ